MSTGESKQQTFTVEEVKAEVRQTIGQLNEMSRSDITFDEFCQTVLTKIVKLTGGHAAVLWQTVGTGPPRVTHRAAMPHADVTQDSMAHAQMAAAVIERKQPLAVPSESIQDDRNPLSDGAAYVSLLAPIYNRKKVCVGAIELYQRRNISDSAREGYLKFLVRLADLFPRWHEHRELNRLSQNVESMASTLDFVTEIHRSIDIDETAFAIANESRRVLAADRVSVGKWTGTRCKVIAVSSQDRFDNRANVIRKLSDVATASVKIETPFWITGSTEGLAPKVATMINDYMDESHCRTLAVIPLLEKPEVTVDVEMQPGKKPKPKKLGALVVEFFDAEVSQEEIAEPVKLVTDHSELALANAMRHSDIFLLPVWTRLGRMHKFLFRDHLSKTLTGIAALLVFLLALIFVPKELEMRVSGVIQPAVRKNLFAQTEGIIRKIHVDHGDPVQPGQLLLELENQDLDMQIAQEEFQLEAIEEELRATKVILARETDVPVEDSIALGNKLNTLEKQRDSKRRQLELLRKKQELQKLFSPISGTVVTWEAKKRLQDLPVTPNQPVLAIADFKGPWQLELEIPQNKIGYVAQAMKSNGGQPLETEVRIATNPNLPLHGKLVRVAERAEISPSTGTPYFRGIVEVDVSDLKDLRPGAGVTARIECGRRSLGFVWFYQIIDFFRTQVFF